MKMWPSVKSEWEYFPDTGWVMGHVTRPVVEGKHHILHFPKFKGPKPSSKCIEGGRTVQKLTGKNKGRETEIVGVGLIETYYERTKVASIIRGNGKL